MAHPPLTADRPVVWRQYWHPRYWHTWIGLGLMRVISLLPLPVISVVGGALGMVLYVLHAPRRRIATRNIESAYPELDARGVQRVVRAHFRAVGQAVLETGISWWASPKRLHRLVKYRDREHYEKALASGRPVILLVGHFVAAEIMAMTLASEQHIIDIYKKPRNELLHQFVINQRLRFGVGSLIEVRDGIKPVLRAMRAGGVLVYLPDQNPGRKNTVFVPFCGVPAATLTALGRLARVSDAVVVPCFPRQLPYGRGYEVHFSAAMENFPTGDETQDALRMNQELERGARYIPAQYFWLHKRYKTRPPGEPDFYR